jgi:hypothetical protein
MFLHSHWHFHWIPLRNSNRYFYRVGLRHWYLNFNWIRTINGYLYFNRHLNRDVDGYFNGVGFRDGYLPVNVHRIWPLYWNFNRDGIRYRYSHFNRVGSFNGNSYFNRHSFNDRNRPVYNNWIGMIDRDLDLDRVRIRDCNWDPNGIWLRMRNSNRHFHGIGMFNAHWDFHRVRSIDWNSDFNREGFRDRDFFYYRRDVRNLLPGAMLVSTTSKQHFPAEMVTSESKSVAQAVSMSMSKSWQRPLCRVTFCSC